MNLFHNTHLVQAIRDAFDLSIPQAIVVLIAYQHGSVSTMSARAALDCDARSLSSLSTLSGPVRKGILKEVGRARVARGSRPATIYQLTDPIGVAKIIEAAATKGVNLYLTINEYENTAKEAITHEDQ